MLFPTGFVLNPKLLRGTAMFAPQNADGSYQGFIILAPSSDFSVSMASQSTSYISQESGIGETLDTTTTSIARSAKMTCNKMDAETKALFMVGAVGVVSQASGTHTAERTDHVRVNRAIELGAALNNGTGVLGVSAVTVSSYEGANAAAAQTTHAYALGAIVVPATPNLHWYMATTAGTSGGSAPTFPTTGGTVTDGSVVWQDMGTIIAVANTDYQLDANLGMILIPATGAIGTAIGKVPASISALGTTFTLSVDYTSSAQVFNQVATASTASLTGKLIFTEANPKGGNDRWVMPNVTLAPSGDFALKSGTNYGAMTFDVAIQSPATGAALYINDIPVALGG